MNECTPRGGWPNVFSRLKQTGELKIAYLGGSITEQSGWRVQSLSWFQKKYPQIHFREINAAIGGTGSEIGAFRLEHDVLSHKPDLVFIEFAVNDSEAETGDIIRSMEGIVRKIWRRFPECDICFVYTLIEALLPDLLEGRLYRSAAVMESVAERYQIPSIFLGGEVVRLKNEGRLVMSEIRPLKQVSGGDLDRSVPLPMNAEGKIVFAPDGVHPYKDTGHRLYTEAVLRSLSKIEAVPAVSRSHVLPSSIMTDNLENAQMLPLEEAELTGPWKKLDRVSAGGRSFRRFLPELWMAEPGAEISFRFRGRRVMMYDILGPDGCRLEISIDGHISTAIRIDGYCIYHRLSALSVCRWSDPETVHTIHIKVLPDRIDKEHILFEHHRNDFREHPEKYEMNRWYASAIFLDGEIMNPLKKRARRASSAAK